MRNFGVVVLVSVAWVAFLPIAILGGTALVIGLWAQGLREFWRS
jgi:hypothetical protein